MRSENYKKGPPETAAACKWLRLLLGTKQLLSPTAGVALLWHFLLANFLMGCHLCDAGFFIYASVCVKTAIAVQKVLLVMPIEMILDSPKETIKQEQYYQVIFKPIHKPSLIVEK